MEKTDNLRDELKRDVLHAYYTSMRKLGKFATRDEIIADAQRSPAPRFYINPRKAQEYTTRLIDGNPLPIKNKNRLDMYNEICCRYVAMGGKTAHQTGRNDKTIHIFSEIVEQPAPSFYLSFHAFRHVVYEALNTSPV